MNQIEKTPMLQKYYSHFSKGEWRKSAGILKMLIKKEPKNFWLLTSLSSVVYEMKAYEEAINYSKQAFKICPTSPLVLWDYANVLYMLDKEQKAIKKWKKIVSLGEERIASELTQEGVSWARSLINDCKYRIGEAYLYLDSYDEARYYLNDHLVNRRRGQKSLYQIKKVRRMLRDIDHN